MNLNMSNETNNANGKLLTACQLEKDAIKMEENFEVVDKQSVIKMLKVLNSIINIIKRNDDGIFSVLLKWFRLYLKLHNVIDPDDKSLIKFYENTVPTIITYLIGCLQYKPKDVPNYHYNLLEILEELVESVQPNVLRKITKFEKETIGCLWTPIELAGDYNTQLKALNIFSVLLNQFDENRQNEEFNAIKWTNLKFFQEKLKSVVQATRLSHALENLSRELLNNYNMNLSKRLLVYSFHCVAVTYAKKYKFFKPLNLEKFWIDINYSPKTLSFHGRYKLKSNSKYEIIRVVLKIRKLTLKKSILQVYFNKPGDFSKYSEYFSNESASFFEFALPDEEKQRLAKNNYVIEYFNNLDKSNNAKHKETDRKTYDLLKNDMKMSLRETNAKKSTNNINSKSFNNIENSQVSLKSKENIANSSDLFDTLKNKSIEESSEKSVNITSNLKRKSADESLKTSINIGSEINSRPKRSARTANKFFKSYLMEEIFDDLEDETSKKRRKQKRKPRQTKSRCKQICKVIPSVDLTKIDNTEYLTHNGSNVNNIKVDATLNDNMSKTNVSPFNTQRCDEVLRQVADVYEVGDTTYTRPGQSYRNFQMQSNPIPKTIIIEDDIAVKNCKKKIYLENQSNGVKKRKLSFNSQENKENVNPQTNNSAAIPPRPTSKTKTILSPHLFGTQASVEISPLKESTKGKIIENVLSSSSECEAVRGSNENILKDMDHLYTPVKITMASSSNATTPRPTSAMYVSNISDSDIEITQRTNLAQEDMVLDTELIEHHKISNDVLQPLAANYKSNTVSQQRIVDDIADYSDDDFESSYLAPIKETISNLMANHLSNIDKDYERECVIFKNRQEENNSSDEDACYSNQPVICNERKTTRINNKVENVLQKPSALNQKKDLYNLSDSNFQISSNITRTTATKCQVTPTGLIMQKIQVSAQKSIILKKEEKKELKANKKCLNDFFGHNNKESMQFPRKNYALYGQDVNTSKEIKNAPHCCKSLTFGTSLAKIHNTESDACTFKLQKCQQNDEILEDGEIGVQQQPSLTNLHLAEECGNISVHRNEFGITHDAPPLRGFNNSVRNNMFQILSSYNTNINKQVDSILRQGIKNMSDIYTLHFLDITKAVFQKSEQNRVKLEEIRSGIGNMVKELERQFDAFINTSKEFDIHNEMCKKILENLTRVEIPNFITKEYKDIFKKIHTEQNIHLQNVWHSFLDKNKAK